MRVLIPLLAAVALAAPMSAFAEEAAPAAAPAAQAGETTPAQPEGLDSFDFGVGLALQLGQSAVDEAAVEAGIVRVSREADAQAGIVLEGHYLFGVGGTSDSQIGVGPFVAVQAGSSDIIDSVGLGVMIGLRRPENEDSRGWGDNFNIGFGVMFDPDVKKLGDGIERNEPLPAGETQIRYREEHAFRGVIMITYSP